MIEVNKMKALITGASSGIGREMAIYLNQLGYDLIVVARNKDNLYNLQKDINSNIKIYNYDLSNLQNCFKLYEETKEEKINIIINNAGYGLFGSFDEVSLEDELNMIDLNIKSLHILTKLFINDENVRYILNVASSAGLTKGGPLMSTYYATKSYVCNYSCALYEELRRKKSNKIISVLCPGPVDTNFNNRANVKFNLKSLSAKYVAKFAIDKMFKKKLIIIPSFSVRLGMAFLRFVPTKTLLKLTYNMQKRTKTP